VLSTITNSVFFFCFCLHNLDVVVIVFCGFDKFCKACTKVSTYMFSLVPLSLLHLSHFL
jgi:hypothetical protein